MNHETLHRVSNAQMEFSLASYYAAFPEDKADFLHPLLMGTQQLCDLLNESVQSGNPLTIAEAERCFGPLSWEW